MSSESTALDDDDTVVEKDVAHIKSANFAAGNSGLKDEPEHNVIRRLSIVNALKTSTACWPLMSAQHLLVHKRLHKP